jgi:hypothetical protein
MVSVLTQNFIAGLGDEDGLRKVYLQALGTDVTHYSFGFEVKLALTDGSHYIMAYLSQHAAKKAWNLEDTLLFSLIELDIGDWSITQEGTLYTIIITDFAVVPTEFKYPLGNRVLGQQDQVGR